MDCQQIVNQATIDNAKKRDDAEIDDLDDVGNDDIEDNNTNDGKDDNKNDGSNNTPKGALRISGNLHQLAGGKSTQPQQQQKAELPI